MYCALFSLSLFFVFQHNVYGFVQIWLNNKFTLSLNTSDMSGGIPVCLHVCVWVYVHASAYVCVGLCVHAFMCASNIKFNRLQLQMIESTYFVSLHVLLLSPAHYLVMAVISVGLAKCKTAVTFGNESKKKKYLYLNSNFWYSDDSRN